MRSLQEESMDSVNVMISIDISVGLEVKILQTYSMLMEFIDISLMQDFMVSSLL